MAEIPNGMKWWLFGRGAKHHSRMSMLFYSVGIVFFILGIVSDATNKAVGLEPTSWFLMMVGFWVVGLASWFTSYFAAKEGVD